jgi:[acyl-carrier-protein] S-malonyltransferase
MNIAYIFPGQGSQSVGMLAELAAEHTIIKETFDEASDLLARDFWQIINNTDKEDLHLTENTQPIMLAAGISVWRVLKTHVDINLACTSGHSLGEYAALVASKAINFHDAVKLVSIRAKLMQSAVPSSSGSMAAILGLDKEHVMKLCSEISSSANRVEPVNFNAPLQTVIAGHKSAVNNVIENVKQAKGKAITLNVSIPSHSTLMEGIAEEFSQEVAATEISSPVMPIINNVDAIFEYKSEKIRDALVRQLYSPVQWVDCIKNMSAQGVISMIEVGPGNILTSLVKKNNKSLKTISVNNIESLNNAIDLIVSSAK